MSNAVVRNLTGCLKSMFESLGPGISFNQVDEFFKYLLEFSQAEGINESTKEEVFKQLRAWFSEVIRKLKTKNMENYDAIISTVPLKLVLDDPKINAKLNLCVNLLPRKELVSRIVSRNDIIPGMKSQDMRFQRAGMINRLSVDFRYGREVVVGGQALAGCACYLNDNPESKVELSDYQLYGAVIGQLAKELNARLVFVETRENMMDNWFLMVHDDDRERFEPFLSLNAFAEAVERKGKIAKFSGRRIFSVEHLRDLALTLKEVCETEFELYR